MLVLFFPGLPWAPRLRHSLRKTIVKTKMSYARLSGHQPALVSIAGRQTTPCAEIQALDSRSGWATLADREGRFLLPDVMWYPGATFDLVMTIGEENGTLVTVTAPGETPPNGILNVEMIDFERGIEVVLTGLPGANATTYVDYDADNSSYYKELFDRLTTGKASDEERISAACDYVSSKLNYEETQWELGSPRRVLETGSQYCGHLSTALSTLLATGNYRTREIHLSDGKSSPSTHSVVEAFYDGDWHLFDPTYGVRFRTRDGKVASHKDVRLDPSIIREDLFERFGPKERREIVALLSSLYGTGFHHFYRFKNR
jgi:hypothetical protein